MSEEVKSSGGFCKWWKNLELRRLDFKYRIEPYFLIRKKKGVTSLITFWISILSIFCAFYSSLVDVIEVFKMETPTIIEDEFYNAYEDFYPLFNKNYDFFIAVQTAKDYQPFVNETIYTPKMELRILEEEGGSFKKILLNVTKCENKQKYKNPGPFYEGINMSNYYCLSDYQGENWPGIGLEKTFGKKGFRMLKLDLNECRNESEGCANEEIRKSFLDGTRVSVKYMDRTFIPESHKFEKAIKNEFFTFSRETKTSITQYFQRVYVKYKNPFQIAFPVSGEQNFDDFQTSSRIEELAVNMNEQFFSYTLQFDTVHRYKRLKYLNPTSILGQFFGTFGTITLIFRICLTTLFRFFDSNYYGQLMQEVFKEDNFFHRHYKNKIKLNSQGDSFSTPGKDKELIKKQEPKSDSEAQEVRKSINDFEDITHEDIDCTQAIFNRNQMHEDQKMRKITSKIRLASKRFNRRLILSNCPCCKRYRKTSDSGIAYMTGKDFIDDYIDMALLIKRLFEFDLYYQKVETERGDPVKKLIDNWEKRLKIKEDLKHKKDDKEVIMDELNVSSSFLFNDKGSDL